MTATAPLNDVATLVAFWARVPEQALLPAPSPVPRLPAPPMLRLLFWMRSAAELEAMAAELRAKAPAAEALVRDEAPAAQGTPSPDENPPPSASSGEGAPTPEAAPAPPAESPPLRAPETPPRDDSARDDRPRDDRERSHALDLTLTVNAPNPWAIMPSRTLRGAGARHLLRKADPLEPSPTLQEQVESEGTPTPRPEATESLWDLIIVPAQTGFRASEQGVKALVLYLDRSQLLRSPTVSTLEEFVGHPMHQMAEHWRARLRGPGAGDETRIVSLEPGEFAHQIFLEGAAPEGGRSVLRGHIGQRPRPMALPFGQEGREAAFWLALIGCRFDKPSRGFLERMHSILYLRPQVFAVPHGGA